MSRGQVSIELLLIALAVLAVSISVLSFYITIDDSTLAMELLRLGVVEKTGGLEYSAFLEKINYTVEGPTINFDLVVTPDSATCNDLDLETVKGTILDKTEFTTVNISLVRSDGRVESCS